MSFSFTFFWPTAVTEQGKISFDLFFFPRWFRWKAIEIIFVRFTWTCLAIILFELSMQYSLNFYYIQWEWCANNQSNWLTIKWMLSNEHLIGSIYLLIDLLCVRSRRVCNTLVLVIKQKLYRAANRGISMKKEGEMTPHSQNAASYFCALVATHTQTDMK